MGFLVEKIVPFLNVRYKIGQWWVSIEESASERMQAFPPEAYIRQMAHGQVAAYTLLEDYRTQHPNVLSTDFVEWLTVDIIYYRALHLLVYGQVFGRMHQIEDSFFEFLDEIPADMQTVSNDMYRQYVMAFLARKQAKADAGGNFWNGMYQKAGDCLTYKALACLRSDIIRAGFYGEQYREMLPAYQDFFKTNPLHEYEPKISELYDKLSRVATGTSAPPFVGRSETGELVALNQFRGQVVYLNFWASWCAACLKKMEFFNEFAPELNQQGIQIVNVSIDEDPDKWRNALLSHPSKGFHVLASSGADANIARLFGVEAVPQYFIIDANGVFAGKASSAQPNDIRDKLLQLRGKQ
jgi:peroxiredoxin